MYQILSLNNQTAWYSMFKVTHLLRAYLRKVEVSSSIPAKDTHLFISYRLFTKAILVSLYHIQDNMM